mmetsp:Transcript_24850/g.24336  ORF Transcript_24850/g.24336 Transcript_24850/m.24336 type:complete len:90 (-) Transcript_24850:737-1006(-)
MHPFQAPGQKIVLISNFKELLHLFQLILSTFLFYFLFFFLHFFLLLYFLLVVFSWILFWMLIFFRFFTLSFLFNAFIMKIPICTFIEGV